MSEADSGELPLFPVPGWVIVIIIFVALAFWSWYLDAITERDILIKTRLQEGVNLSNPHRTAIGIACSEKALRSGMTMYELGLAAPSAYHGTYVKSITTEVESETRARVVIASKAISTVIQDGDTVVYTATCLPGGTTWGIGGTVPKKYWPKQ